MEDDIFRFLFHHPLRPDDVAILVLGIDDALLNNKLDFLILRGVWLNGMKTRKEY
jgi:hypothetical protein